MSCDEGTTTTTIVVLLQSYCCQIKGKQFHGEKKSLLSSFRDRVRESKLFKIHQKYIDIPIREIKATKACTTPVCPTTHILT